MKEIVFICRKINIGAILTKNNVKAGGKNESI